MGSAHSEYMMQYLCVLLFTKIPTTSWIKLFNAFDNCNPSNQNLLQKLL